jgi:hypothetical protein
MGFRLLVFLVIVAVVVVIFRRRSAARSPIVNALVPVLLLGLFFLFFIGLRLLGGADIARRLGGPTALMILVPAISILSIVVRSKTSRYRIYENRVDIDTGLIFKRSESIWLYEIEDTQLIRSPMNLITGDAKLYLRTSRATFLMTGLGNYEFMNQRWEELRQRALVQRRLMKGPMM